jgi:hypothetical protein
VRVPVIVQFVAVRFVAEIADEDRSVNTALPAETPFVMVALLAFKVVILPVVLLRVGTTREYVMDALLAEADVVFKFVMVAFGDVIAYVLVNVVAVKVEYVSV